MPSPRMKATAIIGLFTAILLFAILVPTAFTLIYETSVEGWSETLQTVWYLIPLLTVVAVLVGAGVALIVRRER